MEINRKEKLEQFVVRLVDYINLQPPNKQLDKLLTHFFMLEGWIICTL